jgi:glycosyltransferase involved in cell wall biosynthesis
MKTVLVSAEYPPMVGGVGDYTHRLALALLNESVQVSVVTSATAAGGLPPNRVEVHRLVRGWGWACLRTVGRTARQQSAQILHLQFQTGAYGMHPAVHFLPEVLRRLPTPPRLVVTMHDLRVPYLFPKAGPLRHMMVTRLLRGADAIVVTNGADLARLRGAGRPARDLLRPVRPGRLRRSPELIPLGSSLAPPPPDYDGVAWRRRLGLEPEEALLGHFGLLHPSKGADLLVRTVARLRDAGRPARLLLVGGDAGASDSGNVAFRDSLRALIGQLGLEEVVLWTGVCPAEEAAGHLSACDLVVLPYRDGASFRRSSLIAALALGCTVVTTVPLDREEVSLGPGRPTVEQGLNVTLVPPEDVEALTGVAAGLLERPSQRQQLAQGARELGRAFRWDEVGRRTHALYADLLGARGH